MTFKVILLMILVINTNSIGYGEISNTTLNEGKNLANTYTVFKILGLCNYKKMLIKLTLLSYYFSSLQ